jgi:hypothetical protein
VDEGLLFGLFLFAAEDDFFEFVEHWICKLEFVKSKFFNILEIETSRIQFYFYNFTFYLCSKNPRNCVFKQAPLLYII